MNEKKIETVTDDDIAAALSMAEALRARRDAIGAWQKYLDSGKALGARAFDAMVEARDNTAAPAHAAGAALGDLVPKLAAYLVALKAAGATVAAAMNQDGPDDVPGATVIDAVEALGALCGDGAPDLMLVKAAELKRLRDENAALKAAGAAYFAAKHARPFDGFYPEANPLRALCGDAPEDMAILPAGELARLREAAEGAPTHEELRRLGANIRDAQDAQRAAEEIARLRTEISDANIQLDKIGAFTHLASGEGVRPATLPERLDDVRADMQDLREDLAASDRQPPTDAKLVTWAGDILESIHEGGDHTACIVEALRRAAIGDYPALEDAALGITLTPSAERPPRYARVLPLAAWETLRKAAHRFHAEDEEDFAELVFDTLKEENPAEAKSFEAALDQHRNQVEALRGAMAVAIDALEGTDESTAGAPTPEHGAGETCSACSEVLGSPSPCAITHDFRPGAYDSPMPSPERASATRNKVESLFMEASTQSDFPYRVRTSTLAEVLDIFDGTPVPPAERIKAIEQRMASKREASS